MKVKWTNFKEENLCVKVFDVKTQEIISTFESYKKAGVGLAISERIVADKCKTKKRVYSPRLDKEVACRLSRREVV